MRARLPIALVVAAACRAPAPVTAPGPCPAPEPAAPWIDLLPGDGPGGWRPTPFGGEGEVRVEEGGALRVDFGAPLSGVTWRGELPAGDYEVELVATRLAGNDFFCGLTFPVRGSHLTFVVGGWGGAVVGLSSLDGEDAARNETRAVRAFESGRPYRIRVRVVGSRVACWIDDERVVDVDTSGRELSLRPEVLASRPLGLACYATRARWADVRLRSVVP